MWVKAILFLVLNLATIFSYSASSSDYLTTLDDIETDKLFGTCIALPCVEQEFPLPQAQPSQGYKLPPPQDRKIAKTTQSIGTYRDNIEEFIVLNTIKRLSNGNLSFMITADSMGRVPKYEGNMVYFSTKQVYELNCSEQTFTIRSIKYYSADYRLLGEFKANYKLEAIEHPNNRPGQAMQYLCR